MQGNGNQQHFPPPFRLHMAFHMLRDQAGKANPAAIFQLQCDGAGDIAISKDAPRAVMRGRGSQARRATATLRLLEGKWQSTALATRLAQKLHLLPARQAELMIFGCDEAAARAARRKGEIDQGHRQRAHHVHSPLSYGRAGCTSPLMTAEAQIQDIFNRRLRRMRRDRAATGFAAHNFLYRHMADEILDRLGDVSRTFEKALLIGCPDSFLKDALLSQGMAVVSTDPGHAFSRAAGGVQADEDALPLADGSFDLVIACGTLDSVNDLPGALVLIRRILRPDGLFLAAFPGAGTLPVLRSALLKGDADRPAQHVHPQVDVRAAGDLLARAGFAMPVADGDGLTVRYSSLFSLMSDLRGMGASNMLVSRPPHMMREQLGRAAVAFADAADSDGKTGERFGIIFLSGWAPAPGQPKPARRGSANVSLADALRRKDS